jgi:DNA-binding NarL/FixJ family response regulator
MSVRVLIADDQQLVRSGFRMILESEPGIEVVAEAADGQEAVLEARRLVPDVALIDLRMPVMDGIAATTEIVADAAVPTRVLIVTTFDTDEHVYAALRAGASGFLLKDAPPEELASAVRLIANGEALLAPSVTRRVIEEFARVGRDPAARAALADLTDRELDVLRLVGQGRDNTEVARELSLSVRTVERHLTSVYTKLGLSGRSARAAAVARLLAG